MDEELEARGWKGQMAGAVQANWEFLQPGTLLLYYPPLSPMPFVPTYIFTIMSVCLMFCFLNSANIWGNCILFCILLFIVIFYFLFLILNLLIFICSQGFKGGRGTDSSKLIPFCFFQHLQSLDIIKNTSTKFYLSNYNT